MTQLLDQLAQITAFNKQLDTIKSLQQLYEKTFDLVEIIFNNSCAAVLLTCPKNETLSIVASRGYDKSVTTSFSVEIGQGVTGHALKTGEAQFVTEIINNPNYIRGVSKAISELAVPLRSGDKIIGVLDMESPTQRFSPADLAIFEILAGQVSAAIHSIELQSNLEERAQKLVAISKVSQALVQQINLDTILEKIVTTVHDTLQLETAAIQVWDETHENLVVISAAGYDSEVLGLKIPKGTGVTGKVAENKKPTIIDDVQNEVDYIPVLENCRSEMAVPLIFKDVVIGVLNVEHKDVCRFEETDILHATIFADQAASAIGNSKTKDQLSKIQTALNAETSEEETLASQGARQGTDLSEQSRRLTMIHKAACSLNTIDDPEEMLQAILKFSKIALGFESVAILMPDTDGSTLIVRKALHHGNVEGLRVPIGKGFVGTMYLTGKAGIINDVRKFKDYIPATPGALCEMAVPLILKGKSIGIIDAESTEANSFTEDDLNLFRVFASQAATALKNASMITDLKIRTQRLDALNKASSALNSIHDPAALLDEILKNACAALDLEQCALLLTNADDGDLVLHAAIGYGDALGTHIPAGKGITGRAAASGVPILVNDVASDKDYIIVPGKQHAHCEMAVPLLISGEVIGVLDTEHKTPGKFNRQDLGLFSSFASQSAVAIHNARLIKGLEKTNIQLTENVEEMRRMNLKLELYSTQIAEANKNLEWQIQQLTALHEAGQTITSNLDLDTTLHTILSMSSKIVGSTAGAIKLIDEESKELLIRAESGKLVDGTGSRTILDLPLKIGDRTIGVFELVQERKATLSDDERKMLETMASQAAIAIENARLFENTQRIYYDTLKSLAGALEARDDYTKGHSERVAKISKAIAIKLALSSPAVDKIYNAALLHDIGKIGIRDEVLLAPRNLSTEERAIIEQHPSFGNTILSPLKFLGEIREFVKHHHERWDGSGYPDGQKGEDIPLASRIIAVADTFDAMTSSRPYRKALDRQTAVDEIKSVSGSQFDIKVVTAFLKVITV